MLERIVELELLNKRPAQDELEEKLKEWESESGICWLMVMILLG